MAGIKQPILDVLNKLSSIQVQNLEPAIVPLYSRIWNNQIERIKNGSDYTFPMPAAFVEVLNDVQFQMMGQGFRNADISFRIHLVHQFYNEEGTYEQDLEIFDLRDKVLANADNPENAGLSFFVPTGCTPLACISETQEYDHDNVYHYILNFVSNFTDSKASAFDTGAGQYDDTANPNLDAEVNADFGSIEQVEPSTDYFIIPKR